MASSYSVFKAKFKKTIADAIYQEVTSRTARYYHWFGKENSWQDFLSPFIPANPTQDSPGQPSDNFRYDLHVRRDILTAKAVNPSDVSYVVRRIDWVSGTVYDDYDDAYDTTTGYGFGPAYSGATRLEDSNFYVLTTQFNVYKCIWNNQNNPSTVMPTGTTPDVFDTSDGYKWKFMYTIPVSLRNRFLSSEYMPVSNALKAQFYASGEITNIAIEDGGSGYTDGQTRAVITGDGYREENPYTLERIDITNGGEGYSSIPSITISDPFQNATTWAAFQDVAVGSYVLYVNPVTLDRNFYYVVSGTRLGSTGPQHTTGTVSQSGGSAQLKYVGTTATASLTISNGTINGAVLITNGFGYSDTVTATVDDPISIDTIWINNQPAVLNSHIEHNNNIYQVTVDGLLGNTAPTHTTGTVVNGTAELTYVARKPELLVVIEKTEADIDLVISKGIDSLQNIVISNVVPKYTETPTITVGDEWQASTAFVLNDQIFYGSNLYTITAVANTPTYSGLTDPSTPPTHTSGTISNGDLSLEFAGNTATAQASISGGRITVVNLVTPGDGYTQAPNVEITTPVKTINAQTSITTSTNLITYANGDHLLETGDEVLYSNGGGTDIVGLTDNTTYYVIKIDDVSFKLAANENDANAGTAIAITAGLNEDHTFTLPDGATGIATLGTGGEIVGYVINNPGYGYTNANIEIVDDTGNGSGGVLVASFDQGTVDTLQANVELLAVPGAIYTVKMVAGGSGYSTATVNILGDGEGATARAIVNAGQITKIEITNPGRGYTWTDITITGNAGSTGAVARAIMTPLGGHGSNAIDELNANAIIFYTSISRDKNQGIEINNDYRKVGLVRNFKQFGSNRKFTENIGSGCVLITGQFDKAKLEYDMLLTKDTYKKYRIVEFTDTQILLSVFNNFSIDVGDVLTTDPTNAGRVSNPAIEATNITVTSVTERTIDQFSGDFLFFSVRESYSPTSDQIITVRTIVEI